MLIFMVLIWDYQDLPVSAISKPNCFLGLGLGGLGCRADTVKVAAASCAETQKTFKSVTGFAIAPSLSLSGVTWVVKRLELMLLAAISRSWRPDKIYHWYKKQSKRKLASMKYLTIIKKNQEVGESCKPWHPYLSKTKCNTDFLGYGYSGSPTHLVVSEWVVHKWVSGNLAGSSWGLLALTEPLSHLFPVSWLNIQSYVLFDQL